jgi:Segregation and condensation complex subunit ScpB
VIAALRGAELIATGPRSPQPGAPHTYVTTPAFLTLWGLASLRDLPDLDRLEEAGLLGKAPLPEEGPWRSNRARFASLRPAARRPAMSRPRSPTPSGSPS